MAPKITLDTTVVAAKDQVSADLGDEAMILNLDDGVYYTLDAVGARIWKLVQEPRWVYDVRDTLLAEYEADAERCEKALITFLTALARRGLLVIIDAS
ncbi:MAG: PqqD family peptide modification chaperone [Halobacteriota archaeon]